MTNVVRLVALEYPPQPFTLRLINAFAIAIKLA